MSPQRKLYAGQHFPGARRPVSHYVRTRRWERVRNSVIRAGWILVGFTIIGSSAWFYTYLAIQFYKALPL